MDKPGLAEVEFHTHVEDPIAFACRLLRKAYRSGARAWVTAPPLVLAELDRSLWTFEERDFVPHARAPGASASVLARTPLWLGTQISTAVVQGAPRVLVNLGADAPAELAQVDRLIEIVAADVDAAQSGRERWRTYKEAGLRVVHHKSVPGRDG
jgi:DNA polymerase III subunit chi